MNKHEITRDGYMREYRFSPDQLIASNSRTLHTSRPNFRPFNKRTWIEAIRKRQRKDGKLRAGCLQRESPALYTQGRWLFGSWDNALRAAGFQPEVVRAQRVWTAKKVAQEIGQLRALGQQLNALHMMRTHPYLIKAALRYYRSWGAALRAAGLSTPAVLNGGNGSRKNLLKALREARARGAIPRTLKLQAELYFGSVQKALKQSVTR